MGFASDIRAFVEKAEKSMSDNTNKIVQDLFIAAVNYSPSPSNPGPYAIGLLANQWYASVSFPDLSLTSSTSPNGADSLSRIMALKDSNAFLGKDNTVYLSNNTEEAYYANRLGWQKGQGTNGWIWAGAPAYYMTDKAVNYIQGVYT